MSDTVRCPICFGSGFIPARCGCMFDKRTCPECLGQGRIPAAPSRAGAGSGKGGEA